ncbi:MAG: hypothetical protein NC393_04175 [Clostridium sp.]|nr:hypothetical protein [Clostridium sp.]MCM1209863.1 hypothetical protein [Ruminococcus sp.]
MNTYNVTYKKDGAVHSIEIVSHDFESAVRMIYAMAGVHKCEIISVKDVA